MRSLWERFQTMHKYLLLCPFTVIRGDNHDFQKYLLDIYSTKVYEKGTSEGSVGKEVGIFIAETG
eukprot:SAG11_NODE_41312_length_195_cov_102.937500_1_plen_64_part_11